MAMRRLRGQRAGIVLVAMLMVLSSLTIGLEGKTTWQREYNSHYWGFQALTSLEYANLVGDYSETYVPLEVKAGSQANELAVRFTLPVAGTVYLTAGVGPAETVFVRPLLVERSDDRIRRLLPVLQSSSGDRRLTSAIDLGWFEPGVHQLKVSQDGAVKTALPSSLVLTASRPNPDSVLAQMSRYSPVIQLRNLDNVLDDIPLVSFSKLERAWDSPHDYKVTTELIMSSENGGTMPVKLMRDTQRTLDVEWVMHQLFDWRGGELQPAYQRYQGPRHIPAKYVGGPALDDRPILRIATSNNNFTDGRLHFGRWSIGDPRAEKADNPIYYVAKPMFLPPYQGAPFILQRMPELQMWSMYELALEGCVDLHSGGDLVATEFTQQLRQIESQLTVRFPNRGCNSEQLLALANEER